MTEEQPSKARLRAIPPPSGKTPLRDAMDDFEERVRDAARGLLAQSRISQATLAKALEVSQSSVSNMLSDRSYGLTVGELSMIETICKVPTGTVFRQVGYLDEPTVEQRVYEIPGIDEQAAEALVAAIQAVKANIMRRTARS